MPRARDETRGEERGLAGLRGLAKYLDISGSDLVGVLVLMFQKNKSLSTMGV